MGHLNKDLTQMRGKKYLRKDKEIASEKALRWKYPVMFEQRRHCAIRECIRIKLTINTIRRAEYR